MKKSNNNSTSRKNHRVKARSLTAPVPDTQGRAFTETNALNAALCDAPTRTGKPCEQPAMVNGKCKMHGGKSIGAIMARPGNRNAVTHAAYLTELLDKNEKQMFAGFQADLYKTFPDLNASSDLSHTQLAAFAYIRLVRAFVGDAGSSTIDDLSRVFTRHLAALRVNRDQRVVDGEGKAGPMSPAEYAVEIIQQVRMYAKGGKVPAPVDPALIGLDGEIDCD